MIAIAALSAMSLRRVQRSIALISISSAAAAAAVAAVVLRLIRRRRTHAYVVLYKPYLTLCSWQDDAESSTRKGREARSTLLDMRLPRGLHNVGRLDRDSEGLLLLTSDGQFCHEVTASGGVPKVYWALVAGRPDPAAIAAMAAGGLDIRGATTQACRVTPLDDWDAACAALPAHAPTAARTARCTTWIEVELHEGRNRQVRRMTAAAGHRTLRLVRVGIGRLRTESLKLRPGEWAHVDRRDVIEDAARAETMAETRDCT